MTQINGSFICAKSKITPSICVSNCESEYYAYYEACREAAHVIQMIKECGLTPVQPAPVYSDSKGARDTALTYKVSYRNKHTRVKCHYSRESYTDGLTVPKAILTNDQPADMLTKPLGKVKLHDFRQATMAKID